MFEFKKEMAQKILSKHDVLASKYVRHVGDPVAIIVAEDLMKAKMSLNWLMLNMRFTM